MNDMIVLQSLLSKDTPFRVHNVKVETLICEQDLPMMFLAHYDRLSSELKIKKPLNFELLKRMNDKMRADDACQLLDLPSGSIKTATHIKIIGTSVIVWDELPLALYVQFTNTAKETQVVDGVDVQSMLDREARRFLLAGNVFVLHKNAQNQLMSLNADDESFVIEAKSGYTQLPNSHAFATTHLLNEMLLNHRVTQNDIALTAWQDGVSESVLAHFLSLPTQKGLSD